MLDLCPLTPFPFRRLRTTGPEDKLAVVRAYLIVLHVSDGNVGIFCPM